MKGQVKAGRGTLVGNAGEYYVMAELLKRGFIAALAPRNSPSFDILATREDRIVRIRVKTRSEEYHTWNWMVKKDGRLFTDLHEKDDFTVLVHLAMNTEAMFYYIVPTSKLNGWIEQEFNEWVNTPGSHNQQRDPGNRFRSFGDKNPDSPLKDYRNSWEVLWADSNPESDNPV